ncbi:hypothetical protein [Thiorhodospira sibirica]|uniref:hypothetical protein n=1 Tax=Thiorhodospira sibirica TaxID=154347 RepID=UPI00022C115A|nr:hypothetical protein [Thiorhodospira sibirica]
MPRRPRLHIADYPHHIVQRGHNRAACFFAEEGYQTYRHWLGEALAKAGATLRAYVLMSNPYTPRGMKVARDVAWMARR